MKTAHTIGKDAEGSKQYMLGSNGVKEGMAEKEMISKCPLYLGASCDNVKRKEYSALSLSLYMLFKKINLYC